MTKVEIINIAANHYNEKNRGRTNDGCRYITNDGRMCAVGMCMTDEALEDFKHHYGDVFTVQAMIKSKSIDNILKDEFRGHSTSFWKELQRFHDTDMNWDDEGMSDSGREFYCELKMMFHEG